MGLVDLVLLVAGCLAVLYSFEREGGMRATLTGSIPLRFRAYQNGQWPQPFEEVPAPVVWDDLGLLVSDVDGALSLWRPDKRTGQMERVASAAAAGQGLAGGLLCVRVCGKRAATLSREGEVAVYDETLKLKWRARVGEESLSEGSLAWWESGMRKADAEGTLIVAARAGDTATLSESRKTLESMRKGTAKAGRRSDAAVAADLDREKQARRMRVVALDGATGQTRWNSEVTFERSGPAAAAAQAGMDWATFRLHAVRDLEMDGEQPWTDFAADFEQTLPFEWRTPADTSVVVAAWRGSVTPNVVVVRHAHGISAYHAYSGRLLARLLLETGLHADANGDGLVENFHLHLPLRYDALTGSVSVPPPPQKCEGPVRVGMPPLHNSAPVPVCSTVSELEQASLSGVGPILLVVNATTARTRSRGRLLAYLLSSGRVVVFAASEYGSKGFGAAPFVSLHTPASWEPPSKATRHVSLTPFGKNGMSVIALGDSHAAIVSVVGSGHLLASWKIDSTLPPVRAPVIADLDHDRHHDVVITTPISVLVYRVRPAPASRLTGFLLLAVIAVVGAVAWAVGRKSS